VIYDAQKNKATGVRIIDEQTNQTIEYYAKVIFLNASTIGTTSILLQSVSGRFPNGFGNDSGQVGHWLMDHQVSSGANGDHDGFKDHYYKGRRPTGIYIPRFRNIGGDTTRKDFVRGYGFQADGERKEWRDIMEFDDNFGAGFKDTLSKPGFWSLWMGAWGECLPNYDNAVKLDPDKKDKWGLPLVRIHFEYGANEKAMRKDTMVSAAEMLATAGFKNIQPFDYNLPPGSAVHEMGTARMGRDPKTSVLNGHNQVHAAPNVFITDGSCMTSGGCQNPSLTYMALTARACAFAVEELKKNNL
jgi:choline dehydrogenase-like flavoprotein